MAVGQLPFSRLLTLYLISTVITRNLYATFINNISAIQTCGSPAEQYFQRWQANFLPYDRKPFICNASDPLNHHPSSYMIDGNISTVWQSTAGQDEATIIIDLQTLTQKHLYVKYLSLLFGSNQRPGQIKYSRSSDGGYIYLPWQYFVSYPFECRTIFQKEFIPKPFQVDTVVCTVFPNNDPLPGNETVFLDLSGGREDSLKLSDWLNATHVKIELSGLFKIFDIFSHRWHHYNIREVTMSVACDCNGHGENCIDENKNGSYKCVCQNNACGDSCERCCSLYNQEKWRKGQKNPFDVDIGSACKACNCHNHSELCVFNQTIADHGLSLDIDGNYSGGGVCQNCQHNTAGFNCEQCQKYFFKDIHRLSTDLDTCKPCSCSINGVVVASNGLPERDCIREINDSLGYCFCKINVDGQKCDTCKPGFYNLTYASPFGCENCNCFSSGTNNSNLSCTADGQCFCKQHTTGFKCHLCKDEYYNLTKTNSNGCSECGCDLGASKSAICNKTNGKCSCHSPSIVGDKCEQIKDGFYFPSLHFLYDDSLLSSNIIVKAWKAEITIPDTFHSNNIFRCALQCSSIFDVGGILTVSNGSNVYNDQVSIKKPCNKCMTLTNDFHLFPGKWSVNIIFPSVTSTGVINCDKAVLLPKEFYDPSSLRNKDKILQNCNILYNNITGADCLSAVYTMTMDYLHEPFPCNCSTIGSISSTCEKYLGQCPCKPGVVGRNCNKCQAGFYNFSSNGCTPCSCAGENKICDAETGQCICPPHTIGRKCDNCIPLYWNLTEAGCKHCNCSDMGATNDQCNLKTGRCDCRSGVTGQKCEMCMDKYTQISSLGCLPCNCFDAGSSSKICDKTTGQCLCKALTAGKQCHKCKNSSFFLSVKNNEGCIPCLCSGRTNNCMMAFGSMIDIDTPILNWNLSSANNSIEQLKTFIEIRNFPSAPISMLTGSFFQHEFPLYWISIENFFRSSSVAAYGGVLSFMLNVELLRNSQPLEVQSQKIKLKGSIYLIEQVFDSIPFNQIVKRNVSLTESNWKHSSDDKNVSRTDFLNLLSRNIQVYISASPIVRTSFGYTVRVGQVVFSKLNTSTSWTNNSLRDTMVERCECPIGYAGLSCELCANGYFNLNHSNSYSGICVPCACNNHAIFCQQLAGQCINCNHNTTGSQCEKCQSGFYGNATVGMSDDCKECPCVYPSSESVECEQTDDGSIRCLNCSVGYEGSLCEKCASGYFRLGSQCLPCNCNNNSKICDKISGDCYNCSYNTMGNKCEACAVGYYGDARRQQCAACDCDMNGSKSRACDDQGRCSCLDNVIGDKCTACQIFTYGMNNQTGCVPCDCNVYGSTSFQCDDDKGYCTCHRNSTGRKCDMCTDGLWGLPNQTCDVCRCNITGSIGIACSANNGQCKCKPGVGSRQCDTCMKQHINFTDEGCLACPNCTQLLQSKVDQMINSVVGIHNHLEGLSKLQQVDAATRNTSAVIETAQNLQTEYETRLQHTYDRVTAYTSANFKTRIEPLQRRAEKLNLNLSFLLNTSKSDTSRLQEFGFHVNQSLQVMLSTNETVLEIESALQIDISKSQKWVAILINTISSINASIQLIQSTKRNFSTEINETLEILKRASQVSNKTSVLKLDVKQETDVFQTIALKQNNAQERASELFLFKTIFEQNVTRFINDSQKTKLLITKSSNEINEMKIAIKSIAATVSEIVEATNLTKRFHQLNNSSVCCQVNSIGKMINTINSSLNIYSDLLPYNILHRVLGKVLDLNKTAANISRAFYSVQEHGRKAYQTTVIYKELKDFVNESTVTSHRANLSLQTAHAMFFSFNNQNLTNVTTTELRQAEIMYKRALENINIAVELTKNISYYNTSLHNNSLRWVSIYNLYNQFKTILNTASNNATSLTANLTVLQASVSNLTYIITHLNKSNEIHKNITRSSEELILINSTIYNTSKLFNQTKDDLKIIAETLGNGSNILQKINQALFISQEFNTTSISIEERLKNLRKKLATIRNTAEQVSPPFYFNGQNGIDTNHNSMTSSEIFSSVDVEFKTNQSDALIMQINKNTDEYIEFSIVNSLLVVKYGTIYGHFVATNWQEDVSDNVWKKASFSRMNISSRVTVMSLNAGFKQTYGSFESNLTSHVSNRNHTKSNITVGVVDTPYLPSFTGCLGNLKVNGQKVSLFPSNLSNVLLCDGMRTPVEHPLEDGASFYGNGFVRQSMSYFSIMTNFQIQLNFRTFGINGTIVAVPNGREHILFSIELVNGHIKITHSPNKTYTSFLRSEGTYVNGEWYKLHISCIRSGNISMWLFNVHNGTLIEQSTVMSAQNFYEDGFDVFFGGLNDSLHKSFSGCLSSLNLTANGTKAPRSFRSSYSYGVSFRGCFQKIERGVHFFNDGYSVLSISQQVLKIVELAFKTSTHSGTLISFRNLNSSVYLSLFHGNVYLDINGIILYTHNQTLNDGAYHNINITITSNSLLLDIDNGRVFLSKMLTIEVLIDGEITIGKSEVAFDSDVPVFTAFVGDIKRFNINEKSYLQSLLDKSSKVSLDFVSLPIDVKPTNSPTFPPTTLPPPTCSPSLSTLTFSNNTDWVGFQGISLLALKPPDSDVEELLQFFRINFVITIEFRSFLPDGVIFFAWNNNLTSVQFISLELRNGKLIYQFDAGVGLVTMSTDKSYDDGQWYRLYLIRISQFGAMLVSDTQEYHNHNNGNTYVAMQLSLPIYLGNIPSNVTQSISFFQKYDVSKFYGCIRKLEISERSRTYSFDLKNHKKSNESSGVRQCYVEVQPSVSFQLDGYAQVSANVSVTPSFNISTVFRSTSYDGIIWVIVDGDNELYLQKSLGKLQLIHRNKIESNLLINWFETVKLWNNVSYTLCNGARNEIVIDRLGNLFRLYVNRDMVALSHVQFRVPMQGSLFIGGSPTASFAGFSGCIESVVYNSVKPNFANAVHAVNIKYGCSKSPTGRFG